MVKYCGYIAHANSLQESSKLKEADSTKEEEEEEPGGCFTKS